MAPDRLEVLRLLREYHNRDGRRTGKRGKSGLHVPARGPWQNPTVYCAAVGGTVLKCPRQIEYVCSAPPPPPCTSELREKTSTVVLTRQQAVDPRIRKRECPVPSSKAVVRRSTKGLPGCSHWTDDNLVEYATASGFLEDDDQNSDSNTPVTSPYTVGIAGVGGMMVVMVEKDTPVPVTRSVEFLAENLDRTVTIYAGDSVYVVNNAAVGELTLCEPPMYDAGRRAEVHVIVTVRADADGNFTAGLECRTVRNAKGPGRSGTSYGRVNYFPTWTDYNCRYSVPAVDAAADDSSAGIGSPPNETVDSGSGRLQLRPSSTSADVRSAEDRIVDDDLRPRGLVCKSDDDRPTDTEVFGGDDAKTTTCDDDIESKDDTVTLMAGRASTTTDGDEDSTSREEETKICSAVMIVEPVSIVDHGVDPHGSHKDWLKTIVEDDDGGTLSKEETICVPENGGSASFSVKKNNSLIKRLWSLFVPCCLHASFTRGHI